MKNLKHFTAYCICCHLFTMFNINLKNSKNLSYFTTLQALNNVTPQPSVNVRHFLIINVITEVIFNLNAEVHERNLSQQE